MHLVRTFRVGPVEVRYSCRWHPELDLRKLVDVNACHDRVLVILQAALKRHEFKLRVQDDWNVRIWQHCDLIDLGLGGLRLLSFDAKLPIKPVC